MGCVPLETGHEKDIGDRRERAMKRIEMASKRDQRGLFDDERGLF